MIIRAAGRNTRWVLAMMTRKLHLFNPFLRSKAQQRSLDRLPNVAEENVFLEV
jgi:hypothetical protein